MAPAKSSRKSGRRTSLRTAPKSKRRSVGTHYSSSKGGIGGDSTTQLISYYFEITGEQPSGAAGEGTLAYSLKCDPLHMKVKRTGASITPQITDANNQPLNDGSKIPSARLAAIKSLYRQYRVNSVQIRVTTDRQAGLDNPLVMLTDKGDSTVVDQVGKAMSQAHKSKILTEADRTMVYGWKPKTVQDKEWYPTSAIDGISDADSHFIKVLQDIEKKDAATAARSLKHRIEVTASVSLKDSTVGN